MAYEWIEAVLAKLETIDPVEVTEVLSYERRWPRPAVALGGVEVLTMCGRTSAGRPLMVALRRKSDWDWWIAGVRDLTSVEAAQLEMWEARHE